MDVEYPGGAWADGLDDVWAETDVRDKMPVHHIAVNPVGASGGDGIDLVAEVRKICRKN